MSTISKTIRNPECPVFKGFRALRWSAMYQQTDGLDVARENDTHEHSGGCYWELVYCWCLYGGTGLRVDVRMRELVYGDSIRLREHVYGNLPF